MTVIRPGFAIEDGKRIDVSIVMPCLNEAQCLPHCIANARDTLQQMQEFMAMRG